MSIVLRDIFEKPVDRAIDGVIKADDEASLRIELDEYVITGEIGQRLGQFLDAYNNNDTANGVWISGFFGSGKSHLLKMLALLLENREVDGTTAFDIFAEKLKDDPMLLGALRKAVAIPSKSILFNIDQKADVIAKTDTDALLGVFQKVFDEMCGYYGKLQHIAQFERDLDQIGQLATFKDRYQEIAGEPWEAGREIAKLRGGKIADAYAAATGSDPADAKGILDRYRQDRLLTVEDFANTVKAWLDRQRSGFRLNFFVDEVGQYIADNVKLMTNLQTVAETLNTKCKGQAWLIVTSQQEMQSIIGDNRAFQSQDFSKIMARFNVKMPLNSNDVAEVIQRRLLSKTEEAHIRLGSIYDREENNFKTLFDFSDGSMRIKNYRDRDNFISSYPFPQYQYDLFQLAITSLSEHNAFEGKHNSVGERSMLGVFQEVAKRLADQEVGGLATFDLMFGGIRSALKSIVQQSIHIAERNLDDPFAVRVLKALFLVKYVKGFKPTVRNISILLLSEFDADQTKQRRKIEEALSLLERQNYIQRNGEVYEFLTDEEKDVEAEIKGLDIDPSELSKELEMLAFDTILKHRKIKHLATGHEYAFSRKLDDHLLGREYELAINVITPFNDDAATPETVRMRSMTREELAVVLTPDVRFMRDLRLFKQTDKYIRQARSGSGQPGRDRIISEKGEQNGRRAKDLELRLRKLMGEAQLFVRGDELEIGGEDPQERIVKAFQSLVDKVYVNLPMLRGVTYSEADIAKAASAKGGLFGGDDAGGMSEPEQEILNYVQGQARIGVNVSVKTLVDRFNTKPYGWPTVATLCIAAGLSAKGKLEARLDSTALEGADLARALGNTHTLPNVLLTPQTEYTAAQQRKAKELYRELFGTPAGGTDARSLGAEWQAATRDLARDLDALLAQRGQYPFVAALVPLRDRVQAMTDKQPGWYMTEPATLRAHWQSMTDEMQRLEEENNRIFIDAYGLQDELTPEVPLNEITLTCNPAYRYGIKNDVEANETRLRADTMAEFLSYAVGCMFGRYSLDAPGLILANQGERLEDYLARVPEPSFMPDGDNVIPVLDADWFADDITDRFRLFLRVTFGEAHFRENLRYIEDALGKDIRKYFTKDFYADHVKRYKKRPIYWMFSSPKGTFNALIYMHRYRGDTVSVLLNDYLREFITKLEGERARLDKLSDDEGATQAQRTKALKDASVVAKQIDELTAWERDVVFPLAQQKIEIDLDDGVKHNYPLFGSALKKIVGLT